MMMWDSQTGDARFKAMMTDFVKTYANKLPLLRIQSSVEKYMNKAMDIDHNGR